MSAPYTLGDIPPVTSPLSLVSVDGLFRFQQPLNTSKQSRKGEQALLQQSSHRLCQTLEITFGRTFLQNKYSSAGATHKGSVTKDSAT